MKQNSGISFLNVVNHGVASHLSETGKEGILPLPLVIINTFVITEHFFTKVLLGQQHLVLS